MNVLLGLALFGASLTQSPLEELIVAKAIEHGSDPIKVLRVAQCESKLNPNAIGKNGERGIFQWLPGRGNAWDNTPAYREQGIDIVSLYQMNHEHATYYDIDQGAWALQFARLALQWSCK